MARTGDICVRAKKKQDSDVPGQTLLLFACCLLTFLSRSLSLPFFLYPPLYFFFSSSPLPFFPKLLCGVLSWCVASAPTSLLLSRRFRLLGVCVRLRVRVLCSLCVSVMQRVAASSPVCGEHAAATEREWRQSLATQLPLYLLARRSAVRPPHSARRLPPLPPLPSPASPLLF